MKEFPLSESAALLEAAASRASPSPSPRIISALRVHRWSFLLVCVYVAALLQQGRRKGMK